MLLAMDYDERGGPPRPSPRPLLSSAAPLDAAADAARMAQAVKAYEAAATSAAATSVPAPLPKVSAFGGGAGPKRGRGGERRHKQPNCGGSGGGGGKGGGGYEGRGMAPADESGELC